MTPSGLTVCPMEGKPFPPDPGENSRAEIGFGGNMSSPGDHCNEFRFFIKSVRGNRPLNVATLEEAVRSVRPVEREFQAVGGLIAR